MGVDEAPFAVVAAWFVGAAAIAFARTLTGPWDERRIPPEPLLESVWPVWLVMFVGALPIFLGRWLGRRLRGAIDER